jgi:DNA-binding IclR family transcriptional regulator
MRSIESNNNEPEVLANPKICRIVGIMSNRLPDDQPLQPMSARPNATASSAAAGGTQSIERVVSLLRVVASRGRSGMRLGDITAASGLPSSTCFRMLQRLESEGVLERHEVTRKYLLGPLLYELGLLAQPRFQLAQRCENTLATLAELTQDTVYLSERRGNEAVCSARALGDYPIKALTLDVGVRRPLGVGAGGLAILCALPPAEAEDIITGHAERYPKLSSLSVERVRELIEQGREQGFAFLDGPVHAGTAAVGVIIPTIPTFAPMAAISVAAISSRLDPSRRLEIATQLQVQAARLSRLLDRSVATEE